MTAHRVAGRPAGAAPASAPWVLYDALLATGVAVVLALLIFADVDDSHPDGWAYLWAVGLGALMFIRRSHPRLVVALTVLGFIAYYAAGYTPIGVAAPVAAAVFSAAEASRLGAAISGSALVVLVSVAYRLSAGQDPALVLGYDLTQNVLVLAAAVALGDGIRARREVQRQSAEIAALTAERYRREAEALIAAERLEMSRDLHDSIGHALAVISLHAEVAREAGSRDDATQALEVVRTTATETMSELRRTVAGLRRGEPPPRHALGLDSLGAAVEAARAAGVEVRVATNVAGALPASVETTVLRVVQEAITNIVRHSSATTAQVRVDAGDGAVRVLVADDGGAHAGAPVAVRDREDGASEARGLGLVGMRERVESLGGVLLARRTASGFEVEASLPWEER